MREEKIFSEDRGELEWLKFLHKGFDEKKRKLGKTNATIIRRYGGPGSGHHGHAGRPGAVGGSGAGGGIKISKMIEGTVSTTEIELKLKEIGSGYYGENGIELRIYEAAEFGKATPLSGNVGTEFYTKTLEHSQDDWNEVNSLLQQHGSTESIQRQADDKIISLLKDSSDQGKLIRDIVITETVLLKAFYEGHKKRIDKREKELVNDRNFAESLGDKYSVARLDAEILSLKSTKSPLLYRRGTIGINRIESWTLSEKGAQTQHIGREGRIVPNKSKDIGKMINEGYFSIGGVGRMMGAPGESEVTVINWKQQKSFIPIIKSKYKAEEFSTPTIVRRYGGPGSGYKGHKGRQGAVGGSSAFMGVAKNDVAKMAKERGVYVPPAWTDVRFNVNPKAPLQAKGRDIKGFEQRIYTTEHSVKAAAEKFARLKDFHKDYNKLKNRIDKDFDKSQEAKVLTLIAETGIRVGSTTDTRAAKKAYGASTLEKQHVKISGSQIMLEFTGKKGVEIKTSLRNKKLADYMSKRKDGPLFDTNDDKVRDYLKNIDGNFKPKDFRTYKGTSEALKEAKRIKGTMTKQKAIVHVSKHVAKILGNTPDVAKKDYIAPEIWDTL